MQARPRLARTPVDVAAKNPRLLCRCCNILPESDNIWIFWLGAARSDLSKRKKIGIVNARLNNGLEGRLGAWFYYDYEYDPHRGPSRQGIRWRTDCGNARRILACSLPGCHTRTRTRQAHQPARSPLV